MLFTIVRNILIVLAMVALLIVGMFFYAPTREFLIRIAVVLNLTTRVCESTPISGDLKYAATVCRQDLNLLGKVYSVRDSF